MAKPGRPKKEKVIETPVEVAPVVEPVVEQIPVPEAPVVVEEPTVEVVEIGETPTPSDEKIEEIIAEVSRDAHEGCAISYAPITPQVTHPIMLQLNG